MVLGKGDRLTPRHPGEVTAFLRESLWTNELFWMACSWILPSDLDVALRTPAKKSTDRQQSASGTYWFVSQSIRIDC